MCVSDKIYSFLKRMTNRAERFWRGRLCNRNRSGATARVNVILSFLPSFLLALCNDSECHSSFILSFLHSFLRSFLLSYNPFLERFQDRGSAHRFCLYGRIALVEPQEANFSLRFLFFSLSPSLFLSCFSVFTNAPLLLKRNAVRVNVVIR